MTKARVVPQWGASLAELRHAAGLSAAQVVGRLAEIGIEVDRASIYNYEAGKVPAPDAGVIWGLAHVYSVPIADLVGDLVADRIGESFGGPTHGRPGPPENLSDSEIRLIVQWRKLTPHTRKACEEFIRFQLRGQRAGKRPTRSSSRKE
jgi:transcriptional regulator with XRE-family HTH domain